MIADIHFTNANAVSHCQLKADKQREEKLKIFYHSETSVSCQLGCKTGCLPREVSTFSRFPLTLATLQLAACSPVNLASNCANGPETAPEILNET